MKNYNQNIVAGKMYHDKNHNLWKVYDFCDDNELVFLHDQDVNIRSVSYKKFNEEFSYKSAEFDNDPKLPYEYELYYDITCVSELKEYLSKNKATPHLLMMINDLDDKLSNEILRELHENI